MPVKIPDNLPARSTLESENISVIPETRAFHQDIRPLEVAIFNIMPNKTTTETQLLRLLSNSPLQIALTLLHPATHTSKNTSPEHLQQFYKSFDEVRDRRFDCLIITGAPVETLEFSQVNYWQELQEIMDWSLTHVYSTLYICWGAQAGLWHHYGVPKQPLPEKLSGVFSHKVRKPAVPLFHGYDEVFDAPHSRYTEVSREAIAAVPELTLLVDSKEAGAFIVSAAGERQIFITGHPEYDLTSLKDEYERDIAKGLPVSVPANYFPDNDATRLPVSTWRAHANLLFSNWLNEVYQKTPFNLEELTPAR